ncbi:2-dehydropantoate 2-reductase [Streptomyces parvulus]|uniref:ketopantoate reductase family protein n=1 Tax=Streptomyces parvulus TaxID=146923 RepID=UPI00345467DA
MRYVIIGAGAVGGAVGGRLAESGHDVVLVARGAHLEALRERGLRLVTPEGSRTHQLLAIDGPGALGKLRPDDILVLAVKTQDSVAALETWGPVPVEGGGTAGERLPLLCAQNGVEGQRLALRHFRRVYGVCVRLPATFVDPGEVVAAGAPLTGILYIGRFPQGKDGIAQAVAADLAESRIKVLVVPDVTRWQYAKLLSNLANAVEAVSGPVVSEEALALIGRVRAEGEAVLAAAGIEFASVAEQAEARADKVRLVSLDARSGRGGESSSWQSLNRGTGTIETDYLNGEIALLGRLHGVDAPLNEFLQRLTGDFARGRRAAGSMPVPELVRLATEVACPRPTT